MSAKSGSIRYAIVFLRWLVVPLLLLGATLASAQQAIKVGVYNYSPMVFVDEQGQSKGLFVDVLDFIARQESWKLEYLPGTWAENMTRLESGEIDLLVNIASSEERARKFDFTQQHLFLDWGMIYRRKGSKIDTIFDLENKRVAVLKGSFYAGELKKLLDQFSITVEFVEKSEFAAVFKAIESGEADAGANASLAGLKLPDSSPIEPTAIVYAPTKLRFAARKASNKALLEKLDQHVSALHADKSSIYHESRQKWLGQIHQKEAIPSWAWWMIAGLVIGLSLLLGLSIFLDKLVRKKTADLRESEENLAITLRSIGDAVIATDVAGHVTRMNPTAERLTGWTLADAMGHALTDVFRIVNADTRQPVADPVQLVMEHGQVVGLANHTVLLARDGLEYQIADSAAPIRNAAGEIVGVVLVFSDVTEKYRVEQELRESEHTLREAQTIAHLGGWRIDLGSGRLSWTEEVFQIHELPVGESPTVEQAIDYYLPESRKSIELAVKDAIEKRLPFDLNLQIKTARGNIRWVHAQGAARHEAGVPSVVSGTFQDITERKQAQNALVDQKMIVDTAVRLN